MIKERVEQIRESEIDRSGVAHSWRGKITCPICKLSNQQISHCTDVNGTWVVCQNCGLVDL
jgi:hypothetical protein